MSTLTGNFWHKGQRDLVGNMALGNMALAMDGSEQCSWSAIDFMVDGEIRTLTADGAGSDTILNTTQMTGGLHANNPVKTVLDDSDPNERTVRQNFCSLSVPAYSHVYCIVTVEKHGTIGTNSTLQAQGHFYAGEIVGGHASHANGVQTAKRPELDLTDECVIAEIYFNNTTSGALVVGAATTREYMDGTTQGHIKNLAYVNSL
jgi:hypothetical protein